MKSFKASRQSFIKVDRFFSRPVDLACAVQTIMVYKTNFLKPQT